jgi:arsenate reductase
MEKISRIILVATCYGLAGVLFGAATGCVAGAITGLIFGGIENGTAFVFFSVVVHGVTFAVTGVLWDDGDSLDFLVWRRIVSKPAVLFLCTNNAVRSQMAEALLNKKAAGQFEAHSAGTEPKEIHPLTIRVMSEVGINLSGHRPKDLRQYLGKLAVCYAIFLCPRAEDKCPVIWPGALNRLEWPFEDPATQDGTEDERIAKFRSVRDRIDERITAWLKELSVSG